MTIQNQIILQGDKLQENNVEKTNKDYVYLLLCLFASINNLFPLQSLLVNYFHSTQNQNMLFWLQKDA